MATSFKSDYAIPKCAAPVPLWQSTADLYLHRRCSNTALSQSLWGAWVLVHTRFIWALWACLAEMGFDSKCEFALLPFFRGFSFALGHGVSPHSHFSTTQLPLKHLLSCWCFSDIGRGVSPHGRSSEAQPPLLTLMWESPLWKTPSKVPSRADLLLSFWFWFRWFPL